MPLPANYHKRWPKLKTNLRAVTVARYAIGAHENYYAMPFATLRRARKCRRVMRTDQPIIKTVATLRPWRYYPSCRVIED